MCVDMVFITLKFSFSIYEITFPSAYDYFITLDLFYICPFVLQMTKMFSRVVYGSDKAWTLTN